jgi:hypothetical protein
MVTNYQTIGYPDYAYDFSGITISAGDTITTTVTVTSSTGGTAVVKNVSTGKSVTHTFTSQTGTLCQTNAEWIVEDFESGGSLVPFADFGTVTFTGMYTRARSREITLLTPYRCFRHYRQRFCWRQRCYHH